MGILDANRERVKLCSTRGLWNGEQGSELEKVTNRV